VVQAGWNGHRRVPYGFAALSDGTPYDERMRRLYRWALLRSEAEGAPEPPGPFESSGSARFLAWLSEPVSPPGVRPPISRYLRHVHAEDPRLRHRFPDVEGGDAWAFAAWCATEGRRAAAIPAALAPPVAPPAGGHEPVGVLAGVQVVVQGEGWRAPSGHPVEAALARAGVAHRRVVVPRDGPVPAATRPFYDVNLFVMPAEELPRANHAIGPLLREGRRRIGLLSWEVDVVPDHLRGPLGLLDEVWTWTDAARATLAGAVPVPVVTIPTCVLDPPRAGGARARLGLGEGRLVLAEADLAADPDLVNATGVVEAFRRAVPEPGTATLAIVTRSERGNAGEAERLRVAAAERGDVRIVEGLDPATRDALRAECDCVISLRRGAGEPFEIAAAMAAGRPVIATAHEAHLELVDDEVGLGVDVARRRVGPGHEPLPAEATWADPDLDHAAARIRWVLDHPRAAAEVGARARSRALVRFDCGRAAATIAGRLADIARERAGDSRDRAEGAASAGGIEALRAAEAWVRRGPMPEAAADPTIAERTRRRATFAVVAPYLERRQELDQALVQTAGALAERMGAAERRLIGLEHALEGLRRALHAGETRLAAELQRLELEPDGPAGARLERAERRVEELEALVGALVPAVQRLMSARADDRDGPGAAPNG
jgi:hypothetical protein